MARPGWRKRSARRRAAPPSAAASAAAGLLAVFLLRALGAALPPAPTIGEPPAPPAPRRGARDLGEAEIVD